MLGHPVALASPLLWESPWGVADADSTFLLLFPWVPLLCFRGPQMFPLRVVSWESQGGVSEALQDTCCQMGGRWRGEVEPSSRMVEPFVVLGSALQRL